MGLRMSTGKRSVYRKERAGAGKKRRENEAVWDLKGPRRKESREKKRDKKQSK